MFDLSDPGSGGFACHMARKAKEVMDATEREVAAQAKFQALGDPQPTSGESIADG